MFVPGFGAFVRMHEHAATPSEDARIGLAGPLWGLGAAAIASALYSWTHNVFWLAIVQTVTGPGVARKKLSTNVRANMPSLQCNDQTDRLR